MLNWRMSFNGHPCLTRVLNEHPGLVRTLKFPSCYWHTTAGNSLVTHSVAETRDTNRCTIAWLWHCRFR